MTEDWYERSEEVRILARTAKRPWTGRWVRMNCRRYSTWDEAKAGHNDMVRRVNERDDALGAYKP